MEAALVRQSNVRAGDSARLQDDTLDIEGLMHRAKRAAGLFSPSGLTETQAAQDQMFSRLSFESHPTLRSRSDGEYWQWQEELMRAGLAQPAYYTPDARAQLTQMIDALLPREGVIVDLMSGAESSFSKLPQQRVVGIGAGHASMRQNPKLDECIVFDLNQEPAVPVEGKADAMVMSAGIMYLTKPIAVMASVREHLHDGGIFVIAFSDTHFDGFMSVNVWNNPMLWGFQDHVAVLHCYLWQAGWEEDLNVATRDDLVVASVALQRANDW